MWSAERRLGGWWGAVMFVTTRRHALRTRARNAVFCPAPAMHERQVKVVCASNRPDGAPVDFLSTLATAPIGATARAALTAAALAARLAKGPLNAREPSAPYA